MKLTRMFAAAGLVIASLGVSATADAQGPRGPHGPGPRGDHHWDDRGPGRGPDRGPGRHDWRGDHHRGRDWRGDRGHHYGRDYRRYGYNGYGRNRCYVTWRNHRQVRVCR
ncbi:hypothetical protein SAMN05216382_1307 [Sphingomonas palmae]|uniref:Uncharacterized protein n=1 Tax=Sphingomonas palmae TaxID=1855283 RepID=A0A1H7LU25_9SPHN|nr:hypothetical protein [Sphingomonas palmae]SEL01995.1 hypothetical protein SAMN05216382_1307 [Sphingomonas palmae]